MTTKAASTIVFDNTTGEYLQAFAIQHGLKRLDNLLVFSLPELWKMEGYNLHVQNELLELLQANGMESLLKQY